MGVIVTYILVFMIGVYVLQTKATHFSSHHYQSHGKEKLEAQIFHKIATKILKHQDINNYAGYNSKLENQHYPNQHYYKEFKPFVRKRQDLPHGLHLVVRALNRLHRQQRRTGISHKNCLVKNTKHVAWLKQPISKIDSMEVSTKRPTTPLFSSLSFHKAHFLKTNRPAPSAYDVTEKSDEDPQPPKESKITVDDVFKNLRNILQKTTSQPYKIDNISQTNEMLRELDDNEEILSDLNSATTVENSEEHVMTNTPASSKEVSQTLVLEGSHTDQFSEQIAFPKSNEPVDIPINEDNIFLFARDLDNITQSEGESKNSEEQAVKQTTTADYESETKGKMTETGISQQEVNEDDSKQVYVLPEIKLFLNSGEQEKELIEKQEASIEKQSRNLGDDSNVTLETVENITPSLLRSDFMVADEYGDQDLDTIHLTQEDLLRIIPLIVRELREDNIPVKDQLVLSEMFGDLWPNIVQLAHNPNVDIDTLLKAPSSVKSALDPAMFEIPPSVIRKIRSPERDYFEILTDYLEESIPHDYSYEDDDRIETQADVPELMAVNQAHKNWKTQRIRNHRG